jgi:hypothetical protein
MNHKSNGNSPFYGTNSILPALFCLALAMFSFKSASAQGLFIEGNSLADRFFNSDVVDSNDIFAVDFTVTTAGTLQRIVTWGENDGAGIPGVGESFYAYVLRPVNANFQVMSQNGPFTVANVGTNIFVASPFNLEAGDLIAHYGRGIPLTTGTGGPSTVYYSEAPLPMPTVGQILQLPGPTYPLYNDGGRNYAIAIGIGDLVDLSIARSNENVIVTWPAADTNSLLQTTDVARGLWTTNTSYSSTNGTNILTIPLPVGNMFFRLGNPN